MKKTQACRGRLSCIAAATFGLSGLLGLLGSCQPQAGAALDVSFAPGSIDHIEFFFAKPSTDPAIQLRAIPQLALLIKPSVMLRDYARNDSVTVTANDSSYVYFVPSSAVPKGDQVIVVGYLAGKPVSIDRETVVVSDSRVNEYALTLASPGDGNGLADFGRELYQCAAVKIGNEVVAITRTDDIDCDGAKTVNEATCDVDVLDRLATAVESCDGRDSGGDCLRFANKVAALCAQTDLVGEYCRLGSSYMCDDSSPTATRDSACDGVAPRSTGPLSVGGTLCIDPTLCARPDGPGLDLATLAPEMECTVAFKPGDVKSCTKFTMPAAPVGGMCPDADVIVATGIELKLQTRTDSTDCRYDGEVLNHTDPSGAMVAITLPVVNRPGVRRVTMVRLNYQVTTACPSGEMLCTAIPSSALGLLRNTCE
ncbi:MAG: hypothetical protein KBG15_16420 [Kofleriaceae bacterium]|nr:hypothetical protein [Kofleriaceae bacterium]